MALSTGLQLKQNQRLALTPALRQSLKVLQMSSVDLADLITAECQENPFLQTAQREFLQGNDKLFQYALDTVAQTDSLMAHLHAQIIHMSSDKNLTELALYLSGNLNDAGHLAEPLAETARALSIELPQMRRALKLVQNCDPVGIGAQNLKDCLSLQMTALGVKPDTIDEVLDSLKAIAAKDFQALPKKTSLDIPSLSALLSKLDPKPAEAFNSENSQALFPEILVSASGGGFSVELVHSVAPALHIDTPLFDQLSATHTKISAQLIEQYKRAVSLKKSVDDRATTLLRVAKAIVSHQHTFFAGSVEGLVPLTLATLAGSLQIHPSTVSRTISGKSLSCNMGVFPVKYFLAKPSKQTGSNSPLTSYAVQQKISTLVGAESSANVLSDDKIAQILQDGGVDIARRTVAKYRRCLNIPSSRSRHKSKETLWPR